MEGKKTLRFGRVCCYKDTLLAELELISGQKLETPNRSDHVLLIALVAIARIRGVSIKDLDPYRYGDELSVSVRQ